MKKFLSPQALLLMTTLAVAVIVPPIYFGSVDVHRATADEEAAQKLTQGFEDQLKSDATVSWNELKTVLTRVAGEFYGQEPSATPELNDLAARLDRLEKENEFLKAKLANSSTEDITQTIAKIQNSVVSIVAKKDLVFYRRSQQDGRQDEGDFPFFPDDGGVTLKRENRSVEIGGGSGFIYSSDGYILTNKHVVSEPGAEYTAVLFDGTELDATVIARDPYLDVAVVKVDPSSIELQPIDLGNSADIRVGQRVIAIGNALAEFQNTVTTGVISALGRTIVAADGMNGAYESLNNLLQTDAAINPGNSGGPLVNLAGEVVGMNTAVARGATGIGFAIPIDDIKLVAESIKTHGEIRRPYLGVRYQIINAEIAEAAGLDVTEGALIMADDGQPGVIPGSPADRAGLKDGFVILEVDGVKIDAAHDVRMQIMKKQVGDQVRLKVLGDYETFETELTLEQVPESRE